MRYNFTGDLRKQLIWHAKQLEVAKLLTTSCSYFKYKIALTVVGLIKMRKRYFELFFARLSLIEKLCGGFHAKISTGSNSVRDEHFSLCLFSIHFLIDVVNIFRYVVELISQPNAWRSFLFPLLLFQSEIIVDRIGDLCLNCC